MTPQNMILTLLLSFLTCVATIAGIHRFNPELLSAPSDDQSKIVVIDHEALFNESDIQNLSSSQERFDTAFKRFNGLVDEYKNAGYLVLDSSVVRAAPDQYFVHDDSRIKEKQK